LEDVEIAPGLGQVIINDALMVSDFDPQLIFDPILTLTVGGVRNPRSFKPSLSVQLQTAD
jgi:hypothetical protein